jgi:uncharacterized protein (TIGR02145 family)
MKKVIIILSVFALILTSCGIFKKTATYKDPATYDEGVIINGVKWATRNVDKPGAFAAKPEDAGMFYQFNRNTGWSSTNPMINSNGETEWNKTVPTGTVWETGNCACPPGWRVPSLAEIDSLIHADSKRAVVNGKIGRVFGSGNDTIFLPISGTRSYADGNLSNAAYIGYYWSGVSSNSQLAHFFNVGRETVIRGNNSRRSQGRLIRCVAEKHVIIEKWRIEYQK